MSDRIICYCRNVPESTIREAVRGGAVTLRAIQETTGACTGNQCRELNPNGECCSREILALIEDVTGKKRSCNGSCCG